MTLADLLWRNQGNTLTPELIVGLLHGAEYVDTLSTASVPTPIVGDWEAAPGLRESTKRLVLDEHGRVAEWVAQQTGCSAAAWAGYVCLGLEDAQGMLIAGVVLEGYNGRNANVHLAGIWCQRPTRRPWLSTSMPGSGRRRYWSMGRPTATFMSWSCGAKIAAICPRWTYRKGDVIRAMRPELVPRLFAQGSRGSQQFARCAAPAVLFFVVYTGRVLLAGGV